MTRKDVDWVARFEAVGDLYYRETGHLRPGKDEPACTGRDSCSPENRARYDEWIAMRGWGAAIDRIVELAEKVKELENEIEQAGYEMRNLAALQEMADDQ